MTPPRLVIRRATPDDVPALAELAANAFRDTYRELDDAADIEDHVTTQLTPAVFARHLEDPASTLLVALDPDYVGYAHVKLSDAPPCVSGPAPLELARLYLRQNSIGRGLGAALMRAVFDEARRLQRETIWLGVYERNLHAREFYRRWGFADVGTKEFLFGGRRYDDPVMAARVPARG